MKQFLKVLAISSFAFSACSKKMQTFQFGTPPSNQEATKQVNVTFENLPIETASCEDNKTALTNPAIIVGRHFTEPTKTEPTEKIENPSFKQQLIQKAIAKKIQKIEKLQMSSNMKLGIIIAAVSLLVLIVVAAGLLGGLSGLFWLLGGLGLLAGLLIMLLDALEVI